MKKKYLLFIIIIGIVLISSTSAIHAGKIINLGNITMEIPNELNGELRNTNDSSYYRNISDTKTVFNIYLYNSYSSNYVKLVGFWINRGEVEHVTVAGHPALLVKGSSGDRGNFTYLFFESDSNIVMINLPNSNNVTPAAESMVASTPPGIYTDKQFYELMDKTSFDYTYYNQMQDLIDASYESGYHGGYYGGYNDGTPKGIFSRLFWSIGL